MARIRTAGSDEAEAVAALLVAFRDHLGADRPSDAAFLAGVQRLMDDPQTEYLLAAAGAGAPPAGVAQLRFRHGIWWAAPDCFLEDLFVVGSARGRGLGRALVQAAVQRARARGCRRIELDVNDRNATALALYRSLGFDEHDPRYGGANLLMRLHLEEARP